MKPHWTESLWIMKRINSSSRRICNAIYRGGDTKKNILQSNVNSTCLCRTRNKNLGLLFQYYHNAIIRQCYAFGLVAGTILFLSWTLLLVAFVIIAPLRIVCVACWWLLLFWRICKSGKSSSNTNQHTHTHEIAKIENHTHAFKPSHSHCANNANMIWDHTRNATRTFQAIKVNG